MAKLGFGVLDDFGLTLIGKILLEGTLGLHIASGCSDPLGGQVGPRDGSWPSGMIHLDRSTIPATQPRPRVASLTLDSEDGSLERLIEEGHYLIWCSAIGRGAP